jgi:hypothetical protein
MQVMIELKTVKEQWQPPFRKEIETEQFIVDEGDYFLQVPGKDDFVFRLIEARKDSVIIEFNSLFTVKNEERPSSRQLTFEFGEEKAFTAQWTSNGITYIIKPVKTVSIQMPESKEIIEAKEDAQVNAGEEQILEQLK